MSGSGGSRRMPVAVLGATGSVGQRLVSLLADHPWFEVAALTASDRSAGKRYGDAARWLLPDPPPARIADMAVLPTEPALEPRLVFSALDAGVAGPVEAELARQGHVVVSNARSHRLDADVPLLVPEVNADHLCLVAQQPYGSGAIVTNPNCSTIGLTLALGPLVDAFGLERVHVVTLQAVSGAGYPGISSLDMVDNVVPFIAGEEEKLEVETLKVLGTVRDGSAGPHVAAAPFRVSAQCNRVPVLDGHLECVSVTLARDAALDAIRGAWEAFCGEPQALELPSAPRRPVHYVDGNDRPQPRLDRDVERGMAVAVGRLRPCPLFGHKFILVTHNTVRGAAGGAILCAELAVARGLV
ncbi:MAG: aspartate-semialdehyde dehydrogenase [Gemmatimonadetes bacterium]|nr:aspartate-semialdehyde dehydrogenase [Gemmatimonadota bacterium]